MAQDNKPVSSLERMHQNVRNVVEQRNQMAVEAARQRRAQNELLSQTIEDTAEKDAEAEYNERLQRQMQTLAQGSGASREPKSSTSGGMVDALSQAFMSVPAGKPMSNAERRARKQDRLATEQILLDLEQKRTAKKTELAAQGFKNPEAALSTFESTSGGSLTGEDVAADAARASAGTPGKPPKKV
jgi:hypothetical protein